MIKKNWLWWGVTLALCMRTGLPVESANLAICAAQTNDLVAVLQDNNIEVPRYATLVEAVAAAPNGAGILVLADGYPAETTPIDAQLLQITAQKELRLYVEFPSFLPDIPIGEPRHTTLERVVVAADRIGDSLKRLRILALHDCTFLPVHAERSLLVAASVAGFDTAVFGIDDTENFPILFEHPRGDILVATTKLSQFVTARYAPQDAWRTIWSFILHWADPATEYPLLQWTPTVRPSYSRMEDLPDDAVRRAIVRGIEWHSRAKLLVGDSWQDQYHRLREKGEIDRTFAVGPQPQPDWEVGDGRWGLLEGIGSRISYLGKQPVVWNLRTDCNGESTLAFALRSEIDGDERSRRIASNLLDWVYVTSGLFQNDPQRANYGLLHWTPESLSLYGDNDIKAILGCIGSAAVLQSDRWDEVLLLNIMGNFRTTGVHGFRGNALDDTDLLNRGWRHFWQAKTVSYAPHYEAWVWASYLWLYDKTRYEPLLARTRHAVRMMMEAYPDRWRWTDGIQQERGRMLLTLAWLIRVEDRPEYHAWLNQMADDMERCQDAGGAIREELGALEMGTLCPPQSNREYGHNEASLIQANGDPVADMLYTCNFAFLGLHEAYAATGEEQYRRMADRLAEFLIRIQVRSDRHPELDGGWFRAFDYQRWEYWGSNADWGWGAWSIEAGWTQAWIPTVLALRELGYNLWDLSKGSRIARYWDRCLPLMLEGEEWVEAQPRSIRHKGLHHAVTLTHAPDPRYPGGGAAGLTDGLLGSEDRLDPQWLGFQTDDFEAVIDLGEETVIRRLGAEFLQVPQVGIFLPQKVWLAVSNDGIEFQPIGTIVHTFPVDRNEIYRFEADNYDIEARYVKIYTEHLKTVPGKESPAWLFVDEIIVNREE